MSASPVEYNGTIPTGGDSLTEDLNIYYSVRDRIRSSRHSRRYPVLANEHRTPVPSMATFPLSCELTRAVRGRNRMETSPGS